MASGKAHMKVWIAATGFVVVPGSIAFVTVPQLFDTAPYWESYHILSLASGWLIAPMVNPDKDVEGSTFEELWLSKVIPPLGFLWQLIWYPYATSIKHRDPASHGVVTGTLLRFLYMLGVAIVLIWSWSALAHLLLILDGIMSSISFFPRGVVASPHEWLWPWPLVATQRFLGWMAGRPFEIMWYLVGQEVATIISHILPDRYGFFRTEVIFGRQ